MVLGFGIHRHPWYRPIGFGLYLGSRLDRTPGLRTVVFWYFHNIRAGIWAL